MPPNEKSHCEICGGEYNKSYLSRHLASKKHLKATGETQEKAPNAVKKDGELHLEEGEDDSTQATFYLSETASMTSDNDDEFLNDLAGDKWIDPEENELKMKEERKKGAEMAKMRRDELREIQNQEKMEKARKRLEKAKKEPEDAVFIDGDVELMGRERLEMVKRITQYKSLFKSELKGIRIPKKSPTIEKLQLILDECEALLDLSGTESFVLDGIYQAIRVVEGVSAMTTRFNVSGLSDVLRRDPNFNALARRLMVKYSSFSQVSIEYQITFIVIVSSYVMIQKNSQAAKFNAFLNEPLPIPPQTS